MAQPPRLGATQPLFGANTYAFMFRGGARQVLEALARQGFSHFEVMAHPGHLWPGEMDAAARAGFRRFLADAGLSLTSLNIANVDLNIASTTPDMRAYSLDLLEKVVTLAGDLGAPGMVVSPGKPNVLMPAPVEELTAFASAGLARLASAAKRAGTALWLENVPFSFLPDADSSMRLIESLGDIAIGYVYDIANAYFIGEEPAAALARVGERLALIHVSDTGKTAFRHAPIGEGTIDWATLPELMRGCRYQGAIVLEIVAETPVEAIAASRAALQKLRWDAPAQGERGE
jgi:L-ribulose-5-phosphate 3-epimerase